MLEINTVEPYNPNLRDELFALVRTLDEVWELVGAIYSEVNDGGSNCTKEETKSPYSGLLSQAKLANTQAFEIKAKLEALTKLIKY